MDREAIVKLAGEKLKNQFSAFKAAGAPNMVNMTTRNKVAELRQALQAAIDLYHQHKWVPCRDKEELNEEEGEVIDLSGIEGDDDDEWEDLSGV
ncbi:hypothetical protein APHAL10511_002526 [Amanita phalloides]|nr:hypothetical protein APHAL10511_002526 [Amanita phalloides]